MAGKGAIRKGVDKSKGHCYSPRVCVQGSPNVFTNNIPQTRVGDYYPTHCCGPSCHSGRAQSPGATVFVNNRGMHKRTDPISCGDKANNGSKNVFVNS